VSTEFNPVEVAAWVAKEKAKLDFTGIDGPSSFFINADGCSVSGYEPRGHQCYWGTGPTFADALANLREKIPTGEMLVKKKLAEIATLEAEIRDLHSKAEKVEATT